MELFKYTYTCTKSFQEHVTGRTYSIYPTDVTINNVHYSHVSDIGVLLTDEQRELYFKPYKSVWDIDDR